MLLCSSVGVFCDAAVLSRYDASLISFAVLCGLALKTASNSDDCTQMFTPVLTGDHSFPRLVSVISISLELLFFLTLKLIVLYFVSLTYMIF